MNKIMVCHDGSEPAQRALETTLELFKATKPDIILLTVVEPPLDISDGFEDTFQEWNKKRNEDLDNAAKGVAMKGFNVDAILAVGDPRKMIIEAAEQKKPEMVVLARRGRSVLEKMLLGSVSAYLVRHANFPVVIL
jgi:nucleotide-binding universal stress UspA family protein